jgi:hypothetical protein
MIKISTEKINEENEGRLSALGKCGSIYNELLVYKKYILPSVQNLKKELNENSTIEFALERHELEIFLEEIERSINLLLNERKVQPDFNTTGTLTNILGNEIRLNIRELNVYDWSISILASIHKNIEECISENKPLFFYITPR